jgi:hypothetical protein
MNVSKHPVIKVPHLERDFEVICAVARERQCSFPDAYLHLLNEREALIKRMEADPLSCGWEPGIWAVSDAILGLDVKRPEWPDKTGMAWAEWAEMVRCYFGFERPVQVLWASGANRSGKSTWAAKRTVEVMVNRPDAHVWCFDQSGPLSIQRQQRWIYDFLPAPIRRQKAIKGKEAYVNFSRQNGFTGGKFTLPDVGSECEFRNYMQEEMLIEGGEIDLANCEENVPPDWLETIKGRVGGDRKAKVMVPYTPIYGWNGTVSLFMQGAVVVKTAPAFLLPRDGGKPDVPRALGFQCQEEMEEAHRDGRWAVSENVLDWFSRPKEPERKMGEVFKSPVSVLDSRRGGKEQVERIFERVPRVMRCPEFNAAIVFFNPVDNPYGNPLEVWRAWERSTTEVIRRRLYGVATETTSPVFQRFSSAVHVIPKADIPTVGTNYLMIDPAGGRNWFMIWVRVTRGGKAYVYREWPGPYPINGGMLGPWAEVSGKNEGVNDGKKGPAQDGIGFSIRDYIGEWARLEGWPDGWRKALDAWMDEESGEDELDDDGDRVTPRTRLRRFQEREGGLPSPDAGAREVIFSRIMDVRAANTASQSKQGVVTPLTVLADMGIDCETSVPVSIDGKEDSGVDLVNQRLAWDQERPLGPDNCPDLMFSSACPSVIWAMENWRNVDGNKGACKDPVDLVRYFCAGDYGWEG